MIAIIAVVAFILRLISLTQSLWLDEAINVNAAAGLSLKSLIFKYSLGDFHPPLFHVILRGWILLFGSSEAVVRIPSVILGTLTVYITYLIGKKLFEGKTGLIAATLIATSPLHIYYSQEARMYALAAFLASLSAYFFISIIKKDNFYLWVGFVVTTVLMLYTDYLPYLLLPVYLAYLLTIRKKLSKSTVRAFIPALILIIILLVPWLIIFPKQLGVGLSAAAASPTWANVVGVPSAKSLVLVFVKFTIGRISYDNKFIYALLFAPAGIVIALLFLISLFRLSFSRLFLWFWLLGSIFLAFAIAYFIPIFAYFRFIFVLPAFYLILASAINTLNWVLLTRVFLALVLIVNLISSTVYLTSPKFQRENWRQATAYVHKSSTEKTVVLFESNYPLAPFDYYNAKKVASHGGLDSFNPSEEKVRERVKAFTENKNKVFLFQYLSQITDPQGLLFKELTKEGFITTVTKDFEGVGFVYEFNK